MFATNNKEKKCKKNKTKVILIKYKNGYERLILSHTLKKRKDNFKLQNQCKTQPVNEEKPSIKTQNDRYPIFRAQLKERIVPRCLRGKCMRGVQYTFHSHLKPQRQPHKHEKSEHKFKCKEFRQMEASPIIITISDEEPDYFQYEDMRSRALTASLGDEVDMLLESTRKRMRESDKEWQLLPKGKNLMENRLDKKITYNRISRNPSLNSLDTLVLEDMEQNMLT